MITSEMSRDEGEAANMPQQPYYQFKIIQINRLRKISSRSSLKLNMNMYECEKAKGTSKELPRCLFIHCHFNT